MDATSTLVRLGFLVIVVALIGAGIAGIHFWESRQDKQNRLHAH